MIHSIYFIFVTYYPKKEKFTENFLSIKNFPIIIVDNSPNRDYTNHIKKKFTQPNITIIKTIRNLGYGGGANVGIHFALNKGAEWLVIVNQDVVITERGLNTFYNRINQSKNDILGPFYGELDKKRWTSIEGKENLNTDYISGSCLAINKRVFNKIGYFYEPYFMYYEDADFSIRAKKNGLSLSCVKIDGIIHKGPSLATQNSLLHQYYLARNHLLFVQRLAPFSVKLYEVLRLPKTIYEHIIRNEKGALNGTKDYFFRRFGQYNGDL